MTRATTTLLRVPAMLRHFCGGAAELPMAATDVRGALAELGERFPELHRNVCDETGAVRRHINVFVNVDHIRELQGLDTPLEPGDIVTVFPAVSGG